MSSLRKGLWSLCLVGALGGASGCGQPCRELSEQVCGCMPTFRQQEACKQRVKAIEAQRPKAAGDKAGDEACTQLLERCSCAALAAGDLAACGLAVE